MVRNNQKNRKQKILFLYLKTGGGHLSCARTLSGYISRKYGDQADCVLVDVIEGLKVAKYILEDGHRISTDHKTGVYEALYALNLLSGVAKTTIKVLTTIVKSRLKEILLKEKPHKIVVLHHLLIRPAEIVSEELRLNIPIIVAVTDPYTVHSLWLTGKKSYYLVFSDLARKTAIKHGIKKKRITQFPYFVNEKYSKPLSKDEISSLKKDLGFSNDKKLILLAGGGCGVPKGRTLLKALIEYVKKHSLDVEIAVVCGYNNSLKRDCLKLAKKNKKINIKVYGFIDFVYELMNISDVVITKAGPATIIEILLLGKIPVLNSYVWGQEKGNKDFIADNNLGFYQPKSSKIPVLISKLLTDADLVRKIQNNIKKIHLKNGTAQTAEFIYKYKI
jgi:processive 1,2-diacylglycerol beta-glucosyltransferase/1,2-diacylglycerol 3-beta-galactosyltransferase